MEYFAHIADDGSERHQTVQEHLRGTAELAARFGKPFGEEREAELAGMLHDIGKYTTAFQRRLNGGPPTDHSTAGAQEAMLRLKNLPVAFSVAGHHGGIPDGGHASDSPDEPTLCGRRKKMVAPCDPIWCDEITLPKAMPPSWAMNDNIAGAFYTRMIYSCLVDADFQDTQNFMEGTEPPRGGQATIPELLEKVRKRAEKYLNVQEAGEVVSKRNEVLRSAIKSGRELPRGLYTMTVPTGGGKTFASAAFALEHAAAHGLERVIYVIPYTSIIDQTADVFNELFGEENVLAHYAGAEYLLKEPDEITQMQYRKLLSSENWDAPIIVTTAVRFFESLYSNRSSECRKLHNIANSVIIFDEAQTIPLAYMRPCVSAIGQIIEHYGATAVLCTATQPSLNRLFEELANGMKPREICSNVSETYAALKRTKILDIGEISEDTLSGRLADSEQTLCVVNRRKTAQALYAKLPKEGSFCLTTLLCAADRKLQIKEIRRRLKNGEPCRVVSTSLIEAGVDVDFPEAYREQCGLDSLLQTAGRCNREGKRSAENSNVYLFKLEGQMAPHITAQNVSALNYAARKHADLNTPEAIDAYFKELYNLKSPEAMDKKQILNITKNGLHGCMLPFAQIAERFKLIEAPTRTVYIPTGEGESLCGRLRNGEMSRALMRKLGAYGVECYNAQFGALDNAGALTILADGTTILSNMENYDPHTGLALDVESGIGIFT